MSGEQPTIEQLVLAANECAACGAFVPPHHVEVHKMTCPARKENAMNDAEFRAVLDWRMVSDPFPEDVPREVIDDWIERECHARGYSNFSTAYHEHVAETGRFAPDGQFGVGA